MNKDVIKGYLADYYKDSKVTDDILSSISIALTDLENARIEMINQLQPESATYTLNRWENDYCIENKYNYDVDYRRSIISASMKGMSTCTIDYIKNIALSYSNGEIEVIEPTTVGDYNLIIRFIGNKGIPPNLDDFKNTIEKNIPAHMVAKYEFSYISWGEVKEKTWEELQSITWGEVLNGKNNKMGGNK